MAKTSYSQPSLRSRAIFSIALVLLVTACSDKQSSDTTLTADPARDPGVVHVHGLGINPKDGVLYAATHTGLFRIPESGKAERIAARYQDTMGFTVVGPDHFIGSGHPDVREHAAGKLPSHLGLIESKDAGETWRNLSLSGKADFHALESAHGPVYGWDATSGTFMVSPNGKDWDSRSKTDMFDFAVSPNDPELLIAGTGRGVLITRDGGRTWQGLKTPQLVVVVWPEAGRVVAIDVAGAVWASTDTGASWQPLGSVGGQPEAMLADGGNLYVAVHEVGIMVSTDGGSSWQVRYREASG